MAERFTVDGRRSRMGLPDVQKEARSHQEAWVLAYGLVDEGYGAVEVNDLKYTQPQPEAQPRKKGK